jgi:hypothetical protein
MTTPPEGASGQCADCGHYLWLVDGGWVDEAGRAGCHYRISGGHVPVSPYTDLVVPTYPDSISPAHA